MVAICEAPYASVSVIKDHLAFYADRFKIAHEV